MRNWNEFLADFDIAASLGRSLTDPPAPTNDNFASAHQLAGTSATVTGTNRGATKEDGEPDHFTGNPGGKSVWYKWTPQASGTAIIDTTGSNFDTVLGVYTGSAVNALSTRIANNNDATPDVRTSKVSFYATAGTAYRIAVDGYNGGTTARPVPSGNITLNLSQPTPPNTTITAGPSGTTNSRSASFSFSSSQSGSTFQCYLDNGAYSSCTSPKSYSNLSEGTHTFGVRAINADGVSDPTPATLTWTVDTTAPAAPVISGPANNSYDIDGNFVVSGTAEANSTVEVFEGSTSKGTTAANFSGNWGRILTGVSEGTHTYTATAKDAAGNTSTTSNARTVTVDTSAPTVSSVTPEADATDVDVSEDVTATFSEAMNPNTLSDATFTLTQQGDTSPVTATVTYDSTAKKATLDPDETLEVDTTYTAIIKSGSDGATDVAGNELADSEVWSFTTAGVPPANDDFATADQLTGTSATATGTNRGATEEDGEPDHHDNPGGKSVWYGWPPQASGTVTIDTAGSDFDTLLGVYTGNAVDDLTEEDSNDDEDIANGVLTSKVINLPVTAGITYWIAVDGYYGASGNITLNLQMSDITPPDAPVITSPANNSYDTDGNITISGTAEVGSNVEIFDDSTSQGTVTANATNGAWSKTLSSVSEGSHTYTATASDAADNTSEASSPITVTVDTRAPNTIIDSGPSGTTNSRSASFAFSSSETGSTFRCSLDNAAFSSCTSPKTYNNLTDRQYTFKVEATDRAGNADSTPASHTWTVDTTAPSAPVINSPADNSFDNDGDISVSGTAEANSTIEIFDDTSSESTTQADANGDWAIELGGVAEGEHVYTAKATDQAGNISAASDAVTVTVDTAAPSAPIITDPPNNSFDRDCNITVSGTAEADSTIELFDGATSKGTTTADADGNWTIELGCVAEGTHTYTVKATDAAGNTSVPSNARTVTVDTRPPDTTIPVRPPDSDNSRSARFEFSSSEAGSSFRCKLDNAAFSSCTSPKTYNNLADGQHAFMVQATDRAGNVDSTPASRTWTVDATAPTVISVTPEAGETDVPVSENVTATFSEAMDPATLDGTSFTLTKEGDASPVAADVSYNAATRKATLDPDADLETDATYTATITGGTDGATDAADNPLASDEVWSFTTAPDSTPPDTTAPTGNVTINNGAKTTKSLKVTLALSATDSGSGVAQMCISNATSCSAWQPYTASKSWKLLKGKAGTRTVYVRYKDKAGNVSAMYKDNIKYAP